MMSSNEATVNTQDHELLASIIDPLQLQSDIGELSRQLLNTFGSLAKLFAAPPEKLKIIESIPDSIVERIENIRRAMTYILEQETRYHDSISTIDSLKKYMRFRLGNLDREHFIVFYLNAMNHILHEELVSVGTVNKVTVYPREVLRSAIAVNATALILVHNHPSGSLRPSDDDILLTQEMVSVCHHLNITVHDHIIISDSGDFSFREAQLI